MLESRHGGGRGGGQVVGVTFNITKKKRAQAEATVKEASPAAAPDALAADWQGQPVLSIAGRGSLDEAAA